MGRHRRIDEFRIKMKWLVFNADLQWRHYKFAFHTLISYLLVMQINH